jgi:hypothetical protein
MWRACPAYARQFLQLMDKPDVDVIEGLSPAISIEQKATSHNPRSTVGTVTEIHDYLRLLFARAGTPYCPDHGLPLQAQTVSQMVDAVLALPEDTKLMMLAPVAREKRASSPSCLRRCRRRAMCAFGWTARPTSTTNCPALKKTEKHNIDVVIDRVKVRPTCSSAWPRALRPPCGWAATRPRRDAALEMDGPGAPVQRQVRLPGVQLFASASWSRACSRSTRPWAPARRATAWATWRSSTRRAWWPSPR